MENRIHKEPKGRNLQMINAAVLGSPITHSLSPLLHSLAYEHLGLKARYEAIEVKAGDLAKFLAGTDKNALSLTMPLKEEALKVADIVSDVAGKISCGNTLSLNKGLWSLTSTDVSGFDHALQMHGLEEVESALIIGAGATARAAIASVSAITTSVAVVSRNPEREAAMNQASLVDVTYLPWEVTSQVNTAALVINTTPNQAADFFTSSINSPSGTFFEVLYHPWPTSMSKVWSKSSGHVIDGLDLLIHQAISQIEIFAGLTCDREFLYTKMRAAALQKLA
jgi:shikimate dehydrogenase